MDLPATCSLDATAFVETGTFGFNGANRVYTASYFYHNEITVTSNGSISGQPSVVLVLEKYVSGSWSKLARQTISGTATPTSWTANVGDPELLIEDMGGSFTFTDTTGGLSVADLRARIESRVLKFSIGGGVQHTDYLLQSVEE